MKKLIKSFSVFLVILFSISSVNAATLTDRLKDGHKLRLGFGTAVPWAYAGDNGEALGFVNMIALTVLEEMGITEHETKVFEWSGLIPGINANRSDMITGGMYILKSRCANINFSDPIGVFGDAMLVPKGNPKNINKLQLEGLVKAGAFDNINTNRQSLYNSIPNIILKSKSHFENESANQIELFSNTEDKDNEILIETNDWKFEDKLSKEFETLGFFISDHPLNQYKTLFSQYNIISYEKFYNDDSIIRSNIASTVLKIQEKKTLKGNSYAIVKFSDLSRVFELFVFSDIFETNREILIEGNSLMITLMKNFTDEIEYEFKSLSHYPLLYISALTKQRVSKVLKIANKVFNSRKLTIKTSLLNKFLQKSIKRQSPPATHGKVINLNYMTQVSAAPHLFVIYTNYPKLISVNYKRFIENQLREEFDLLGVPIRISFRKK